MFRKFEPNPVLKKFILFYFELDWKMQSPEKEINYLCLPTGCSFIGFQKKGRIQAIIDDHIYKTEEFYVNVQTTIPYQLYSSDSHLRVIVVCLKPTALYHLFRTDVSKIINTGANPQNLFKSKLREFTSQFENEHSMKSLVKLLDKTFINQLKHVNPKFNFIDIAVDIILKSEGVISIDELIIKLKVSKRYFQKKFKEMVGITPSLYIKIIRYNFIFSSFSESDAQFNSSNASLYFYDSAHYSKSFKKFLGMSPSEFERSQYPFIELTAIEKAVWIHPFDELSA